MMLSYCYKIQFRWTGSFIHFSSKYPPPWILHQAQLPPLNISTISLRFLLYLLQGQQKNFFLRRSGSMRFSVTKILLDPSTIKNPATTVNAIIGTDCVAYLNTKTQFPFMDFSFDTPPRPTSIMEYPTEFPSSLVGMMMKYNSYEKKK